MTGKSYVKTRFIVSNSLLSPLSGRKSFNDAAISFRKSVNSSSLSPHLDANISVKALIGTPSKGDTDGKKRTNKGGIPGVETFDGGYRYDPNQKWEPGKVLKIHTNYRSRLNQRIQEPNWGWVDETKPSEAEYKPRPQIIKKKYKVNPKNGEPIESSVAELSPFTATGNEPSWMMGTKQLPGKTIGQIMRGASLLQSAARAVGVITDSDGKLRCPPGTPAANQFTDAMGSNCFGMSASEIYNLAQGVANEAGRIINEVSPSAGLASGGRESKKGNFLNTLGTWRKLIGDSFKEASEIPWMSTGRRNIQPSDWEIEELPGDFAAFKDGALRGRKNLREMRNRVNSLLNRYNIRQDGNDFDQNSSLIELFERLREDGIVTTDFLYRPETQQEWINQAYKTLLTKFGEKRLSKLSEEQLSELLKKEVDLQFEVERAMLSELLMSYIEMPEQMRMVGYISWVPNYNMANNFEAEAAMDFREEGSPKTRVEINLPRISHSAQEYLPELLENERARLEAEGGGTEAENAAALHDFLVSSFAYSKQTAALIGGTESFARHIMSHEIIHTVQLGALVGEITDEIARTGRIRFYDTSAKKWEYIYVSSIKELTNGELSLIIGQILKNKDGVKKILPSVQRVIDDANTMRWLAGKYPDDIISQIQRGESTDFILALEIMAELGALRKQGVIHGPELDDALAWMDEHVDTRYNDERGVSDAEEISKFLDLITYAQANSPREVAEIFRDPVWTEERVYVESRREKLDGIDSLETEDEIIDLIADKEFEIEQLSEKIRENPDDTELSRQLKDAREELARAKQSWRRMFPDADNLVLQEKVKRSRDKRDKLSPQEIKKRNDRRDLESMKNSAEKASEEDIVNTLAFMKKKLEDKNLSEESREKIRKYIDIYRKAFTKKRRENGDIRTPQAISKDLDRRIRDRITPPKPKSEDVEPEASGNPNSPKTKGKKPKNIKRPKNEASVTKHTEKEREKLFTESTAKERVALVELSDPTEKPIAEILNPEKRVDAIETIRSANNKVMSLGLEPDPTSHLQGSIEEQLDNILMPVLDVLERSELESSVEIEAIIDLTEDQINGNDASLIQVDGMVSGRLVDGMRGPSVSQDGKLNEDTGKTPYKVVIQAESGQRGYYPHWSDSSSKKPANYEQKVVLPPGKLEIVERVDNPDGSKTIIARVAEQKNTEEILDGILNGPDSNDIPPGARVQIQRSVNKHIIERRKNGSTGQQSTPQDQKEIIEESSDILFEEVFDDGGSFGTQVDPDYVDSSESNPDSPDSADAEVFGPVETREERRKRRVEEVAEVAEEIVNSVKNGEANEELGISPDDIDPEVLRILEESTPEELEQILADEAEKAHQEIDSRPRDVIEEEDLEEIVEESVNPQIVPSFPTPRKPTNTSDEQTDSGQNKPREPKVPGNVDPDTGEIIEPEETFTLENQEQRYRPGVVYKSDRQRQRKSPTELILRVLEGKQSIEHALSMIQGKITGGEDSYQGRTSEAGRFVQGKALSAFGTANLSELTPEQIVWLMDTAIYEMEKNKVPDRSTYERERKSNKYRSLSHMVSSLQDYLDLMHLRTNKTVPYPGGNMHGLNWNYIDQERPIVVDGEKLPPIVLSGSMSTDPYLDQSFGSRGGGPRIVSTRGDRDITESIYKNMRDLTRFLLEDSTSSSGVEAKAYIEYVENLKNLTPYELTAAAEEMEMKLPYFYEISPRVGQAIEEIINDVIDLSEIRNGGLSSGMRGRVSTRVARKLINPLIDRLDADEETKEKIKIIAEVVAATASKGPTGAVVSIATEAARRGGREVAELALRKLVDSGKITEEQSKVAMKAVDRVAPEGIPDPLMEALMDGYEVIDRFVDDKILTDKNKERISEATANAKEKLADTASSTREAVGDAAKKAKEKTRRSLSRLKDREKEIKEMQQLDDVIYDVFSEADESDPFSATEPVQEGTSTVSYFDDPFADPPSISQQAESRRRDSLRFIRRLRRDEVARDRNEVSPVIQQDEYDPFTSLSSGSRKSLERQSRQGTRIRVINKQTPEERNDK